jgi:hypothetical protein
MTHDLDHQTAPLFMEVSETEQEQISGGCGFGGWNFFYFDQTDIESYASNDSNMSGSGGIGGQITGSSRSSSAYRLSRTTLAFGGFFGGSRYGLSRWGGFMSPHQGLMGFLAGLLG